MILIPITVILPMIIAITTAFSYKKVILTISPKSNVNQDRLNSGCALAYPDTSVNYDILVSELNRRGVLVR